MNNNEENLMDDIMKLYCPVLDDFILPYPNIPSSDEPTPTLFDWVNDILWMHHCKSVVKENTKRLAREKRQFIKLQVRSIKSYITDFNNPNIPSIWQTNRWGERMRTYHSPYKRIRN